MNLTLVADFFRFSGFASPDPNGRDTPAAENGVAEVIETSLDLMSIVVSCFLWTVGVLVAAQLISFTLRYLGRKHRLIKYLERRSRVPGFFTTLIAGVTIGWHWSVNQPDQHWYAIVTHALLILCIAGVTWWLMNLSRVLEDMTRAHTKGSKKPSRLLTQAQVLHRVAQAFFAVSGIISITLTFPAARAAMGSLLASAGIISLIAGIAAQGTLSNMFAGLQIAFSDSIRVGDLVVVQGQQGTIEEITLTYVVVHMWDGRRLILPSKQFVEESFENWTKRDTNLLGTIEIPVDWRLPMASFRTEVERILNESDLWDGRTANVQVTGTTENTMTARVVVSASNSGDLWDLRCYMREHLIDWIQGEAPYALPRRRLEPEEIMEVKLPLDEIEIERQLREKIIETTHLGNESRQKSAEIPAEPATLTDPYGQPLLEQYARILQSKRKSWRDKAQKLESDSPISSSAPAGIESLSETKQMSVTATLSAERLFSGSPDAEERRKLVNGPQNHQENDKEDSTVKRNGNTSADKATEMTTDRDQSIPQSFDHSTGKQL